MYTPTCRLTRQHILVFQSASVQLQSIFLTKEREKKKKNSGCFYKLICYKLQHETISRQILTDRLLENKQFISFVVWEAYFFIILLLPKIEFIIQFNRKYLPELNVQTLKRITCNKFTLYENSCYKFCDDKNKLQVERKRYILMHRLR